MALRLLEGGLDPPAGAVAGRDGHGVDRRNGQMRRDHRGGVAVARFALQGHGDAAQAPALAGRRIHLHGVLVDLPGVAAAHPPRLQRLGGETAVLADDAERRAPIDRVQEPRDAEVAVRHPDLAWCDGVGHRLQQRALPGVSVGAGKDIHRQAQLRI